MERRTYLSACVATGLAGCTRSIRDWQATTAGSPGTRTPDDSTPTPGEPATETPTPGEPATETPTPGEPATETPTPVHPGYDDVEVHVTTPAGTELGSVTAAVADEPDLRYRGLSDTESLPEDRGMLFVYDEVADRTFVMRDMDFGIDIVYADAGGSITRIHHAPEPDPDEDGSNQTYPGRGQYVLEVNYDWTTERGVEEGDLLDFDL
jgi:uncharacterized membrane protein (UPF0127 family)